MVIEVFTAAAYCITIGYVVVRYGNNGCLSSDPLLFSRRL